MAVEVQSTSYLFLPLQSQTPKNVSQRRRDFRFWADMQTENEQLQLNIAMESRPDVGSDIPWLYNPIHDMESVMWLSNYFTIGKNIEFPTKILYLDKEAIIPETQAEQEKRILRQDNFSSNLFYRSEHREKVLRSLSGWNELIHPALVKAGILRILNNVRSRLVARYQEVEKDISPSSQILGGLDLYQGMIDDLVDASHQVESVSPLAAMKDLARKANELRAKTALPVAQLQTMSLQDAAVPRTNTTRDTNPTSLGTPPSTTPAYDADPSDPPGGSSKTVKSTGKTRQRAPPTAPTRIQPQRAARSRG